MARKQPKNKKTKIRYATRDRNVLRGYVVGRAWPNKKSAGESSQAVAAHP